MPGPGSIAIPKPRPRVLTQQDRRQAQGHGALSKPARGSASRARRSDRDRRARVFRDQVWRHSGADSVTIGICDLCKVWLHRSMRHGVVHHRKGRNVAPEDRYNPAAAELLCTECHLRVHHQLGDQQVVLVPERNVDL